MNLVQLLDCNDTLGTCCNDYGLVTLLDSARRFIDLLQIIVPILLILTASIQLVKIVANPDDKKVTKNLYNKFFAAVIIFFIPVLVNVILGMMPETFSISSCWQEAKVSAEVLRTQTNTYIKLDDNKGTSPILSNASDYEGFTPSEKDESGNGSGSSTGGAGEGSATGKAIVSYAKSFVGQRYVWGGTWNGEKPYTGTDCSGFVQGVFKHHGINLTRTTRTQWADKGKYTLVNANNIRAGDLIMYDGHVGILTGNGNEIVHAKGSKWGVVVDSDYRKCSSHAILGIMRIKGVN